MNMHRYAENKREYNFIDKLISISKSPDYWEKVGKLCKNVTSDKIIRRYQMLAEIVYDSCGNREEG